MSCRVNKPGEADERDIGSGSKRPKMSSKVDLNGDGNRNRLNDKRKRSTIQSVTCPIPWSPSFRHVGKKGDLGNQQEARAPMRELRRYSPEVQQLIIPYYINEFFDAQS